ncbi:four helix bundle protein [Thiohalophilus sp.]|uniref:four helix bundle protein n=1 Tax=Thiohalophilus sp. TaxID=3028392 RepID=UPI002ACEECB3|nr:four helix bundle protein [Thiohalophilus sp.]MDZ7804383.1 four helix bundle protein [Thiohalophilus sp.]
MDKPHKKLKVWKQGIEIVEEIYRITRNFPGEERFGLVSQMRRCAVSIPSNIAEGSARNGNNEFRNFLHIAQASLSELDTQLEITLRLGYIKIEAHNEIDKRLNETDKMLSGLIRSLKK